MKQKWNCLAIMTIVMFGGKKGRLASRRTPSLPWRTGVAASCCGGALHKIYGMRKKHYMDILKQHLKTSVRKLKLGRKWVFQMDNDPKHTSKFVAKWLKDNKGKVLEWSSQSPDLNSIENVWADLKMSARARRPTILNQLHQLCQEEWAEIHPIYCGKLVEGYPKRLTQVKQFKSNDTMYLYWLYVVFWPTGNVMK